MVPLLLSPIQDLGLVRRPGPTSAYKDATPPSRARFRFFFFFYFPLLVRVSLGLGGETDSFPHQFLTFGTVLDLIIREYLLGFQALALLIVKWNSIFYFITIITWCLRSYMLGVPPHWKGSCVFLASLNH